jgi:hypothetical protein
MLYQTKGILEKAFFGTFSYFRNFYFLGLEVQVIRSVFLFVVLKMRTEAKSFSLL